MIPCGGAAWLSLLLGKKANGSSIPLALPLIKIRPRREVDDALCNIISRLYN